MASNQYLYQQNINQVLKLDDKKQKYYQDFIVFLDRKTNFDDLSKCALLSLFIDDLKNCNQNQINLIIKDFDSYYKKLKRSNLMSSRINDIKQRDYETYSVSGIWEVFTVFIALSFISSLINQKFVVNGIFDGIVASIALAVGVRSLLLRRKIVVGYKFPNRIFTMDVLTVIFCFFIKFITASQLDITFLILVIMYLVTKKLVKKSFEKIK